MTETAAAFLAARQATGWSRNTLGQALGVDEKQIRRWEQGADIPDAVMDWLLDFARWLKQHPPPRRPWTGASAA